MSGLLAAVASIFPRSTRAKMRHGHYVLTGNRPKWHYERFERDDFFRRAMKMLAFNGIEGDYTEFGCHGGMTFGMAHRYSTQFGAKRHFWAFDSFQGLPPSIGNEDEHPVWIEGEMSTSLDAFVKECRLNGIPDTDVTTVPGFYDDTLEKGTYKGPLPDDIAMAYVDCDLYTSTVPVMNFLRSRMKHGMLIAFDDYFCHSATAISGERAAMLEFLASDDRFEFMPYQTIGWHGMSFIVEDKQRLDRHRAQR